MGGNDQPVDASEITISWPRAHQHLAHNLAMRLVKGSEQPELLAMFQLWLPQYAGCLNVHPAGPNFLIPPAWH
jgi:hypothetical protein